MAIKIKRDVNPTAAAYGSMVGGRGKRQSEDAKILASLQRSGGGGGGTGGGARAGANASLISAPSGGGGAPLGSLGGLVSPPRSGGGVSGVSSPGGRKKGYLGSTSARATMTDADYGMYSLQQGGSAKRPVYNLLDNEGNVVRSYSQAQWDHLQKRGHSNSTMDRADSAAFFHSQGGQTAEEKAAAIRQGEQEFRASEAQKSRDAQAASQKQQQEWSSAEKQKDREAQTETRNAEQKWRAAEAEKARQAQADREREGMLWRTEENEKARQGILDAERRKQQRLSYAEQGYSQEQILKLEDNDRMQLEIDTDPNASQEQKDQALLELEEERKKIGGPLRPPAKTLQEEYNKSIVVDEKTGIRYRKNSRGDFERVEDALDADGEAAERRNSYLLKRVEAERAQWIAAGNTKPFDAQKSLANAASDYDAVYGAQTTKAKNAPAAIAGGGKTKRPLAAGGVESYSDNKSGGEVVFGSNGGQPSGQGVGNALEANAPKAFLPEGREGTKIYSQIPENVMSEFRRLYPDADGWDVITGKYDKHLRRVAGRMGDTVTGAMLDNALAAERTPQKMKEVQDLVRDYRAQKQKEKEDAYLEELLAAQKEAEDEAFRIGVEKDYDDDAVKRTVVGLMDSQYAKLYRKYKITSDEGRRLLKNKNK